MKGLFVTAVVLKKYVKPVRGGFHIANKNVKKVGKVFAWLKKLHKTAGAAHLKGKYKKYTWKQAHIAVWKKALKSKAAARMAKAFMALGKAKGAKDFEKKVKGVGKYWATKKNWLRSKK